MGRIALAGSNPARATKITNILYMFKCECGREFETQRSLNSHARFCSLYKKKKKKVSKYKINENLWRCECGKEFNNYQSLNAHLSHCIFHHECLGTIQKLRPSEINHSRNWENKTPDEILIIHKKAAQTRKENIKLGKYKHNWFGKHHTEESKEKTRKSTIKYIESLPNYNGTRARYSHKACEYINKLNEEKHWNLQHAENGGEYFIAGYFVDGYDKDLNIVFEYDEPAHYINKEENILKDRDIQRQQNIINKLNCEFWRYNEYLNFLYKVN